MRDQKSMNEDDLVMGTTIREETREGFEEEGPSQGSA
jgi:hypothetical protein